MLLSNQTFELEQQVDWVEGITDVVAELLWVTSSILPDGTVFTHRVHAAPLGECSYYCRPDTINTLLLDVQYVAKHNQNTTSLASFPGSSASE